MGLQSEMDYIIVMMLYYMYGDHTLSEDCA